MNSQPKPRIGIIGSGRLGTAIARLSLRAGYEVRIANSRGPDTLALIMSVLLPGAIAATVDNTLSESDIIVLAIPLNKYSTLPKDAFKGKVVIDAMNYWPPTEGSIPEFENGSSSEYLQSYFTGAQIVKTLNHVAYNELEEHSLPLGRQKRRALLLSGDHSPSKEEVSRFIDSLGFDAVDIGELHEGKAYQPDTKLFNTRFTKDDVDLS